MKVAALAPAAVLSWSSSWGPLKRGLQGAEEMIPSGGRGIWVQWLRRKKAVQVEGAACARAERWEITGPAEMVVTGM